jgi:hypothetical protein
MNAIPLSQLVPVLQLAIGPVILISGVSLLLLTLTNRFGRLLDRARLLSRERAAATEDATGVGAQIDILHRRATILRLSIILGAIIGDNQIDFCLLEKLYPLLAIASFDHGVAKMGQGETQHGADCIIVFDQKNSSHDSYGGEKDRQSY